MDFCFSIILLVPPPPSPFLSDYSHDPVHVMLQVIDFLQLTIPYTQFGPHGVVGHFLLLALATCFSLDYSIFHSVIWYLTNVKSINFILYYSTTFCIPS